MNRVELDGKTYIIKYISNINDDMNTEDELKKRNCDKVIIEKNKKKFLFCDIVIDAEFTDIEK